MNNHDHNHDHDHDHDENEIPIVELIGEDGQATRFVVIASLGIDDKDYAILAKEDDEDEEEGVIIFRVTETEGEFTFDSVDDEEELQAVADAYMEMFAQEDEQGCDEHK